MPLYIAEAELLAMITAATRKVVRTDSEASEPVLMFRLLKVTYHRQGRHT